MTAPDEELVQQLAALFREVGDRYGTWTECAREALTRGLVIPAEPVRQVAARYDGKRTNGSAVANRLRAILGDPQHQEKQ